MTAALFAVKMSTKSLEPLPRKRLDELGLSEPQDLEAWLASAGQGLFDRDILWIARQDRPDSSQRSDLIGVDAEGDLLIAELKRGEVHEDTIVQALVYAAEYALMSADDLATRFAAQSAKPGPSGLVAKATSEEDAKSQLSRHVDQDAEVNENQTVLLVGENFSANVLAVCEFLRSASGEPTLFLECWQYSVFEASIGTYYFFLDQVFPPPNLRQQIEEKRDAVRSGKYARDPIKTAFMRALLEALEATGQFTPSRRKGQSYECRIRYQEWPNDRTVVFSLKTDHPRLVLPPEFAAPTDLASYGATTRTNPDGGNTIEFTSVDLRNAKLSGHLATDIASVIKLQTLLEPH